jgi:tRNA pseudouridine32 synthase/23S rRNA pseudouridine746 synthase
MYCIEIIFSDPHLLVINKPAGLLAVPGRGADKADCVHTRLKESFADALVVHRLDQATSGLMVFARTPKAQRELGKGFAAQQVSKTYLAVVNGQVGLTQDWQRIDKPIGADWPRRPKQRIDVAGKPSVTLWRSLGGGEKSMTSVLELKPLSGRTHQLRVHLMSIGLPIVGDSLYSEVQAAGSLEHGEQVNSRMLLHAYQLEFEHPVTGETLKFVSHPEFLHPRLLKSNSSECF